MNIFFHYLNRLSTARFFAWSIAIPTFISLFYNVIIASDIYIAESKFSVFVEGEASSMFPMGGGLDSIINSTQDKDLMAIEEFISSYNLLKKIDDKIGLKALYNSDSGDVFTTISSDATIEGFLEYFRKMVDVKVSRESSIIHLRVRAFTPEDAKTIADAIISITEDFINDSLSEVREDTVRFARNELKKSEDNIDIATKNINDFKKQNKNFNPTASSLGMFEIIQGFELEKAKLNSKISAMRKIYSNKHVDMIHAKNQIQAIDNEIKKTKESLVGKDGKLSDLTDKYNQLQMQNEFSLKRYEIALLSYHQAVKTAQRKNKYIIMLSSPFTPEIAEEPRKILNIMTVLLVSFLSVSLSLLFISSVKDHVIR